MQSTASPSKKSARAGRLVASRYKEAAKKKAENASMFLRCDRSLERSKNLSHQRSNSGKRGKMTSTPTSSIIEVPFCDASAIVPLQDESFQPCLPLGVGGARPKNLKKDNQNTRTAVPIIALPLEDTKNDSNSKDQLEDELDLLYSQRMQAKFLETKAMQTLEDKTSEAMKQLLFLWNKNLDLMKKENYVRRELSTVQYIQQLVPLCEEMLSEVFLPIHKCLTQLLPKYEEIADGIASVNSKLPVVSILSEDFQKDFATTIQNLKNFVDNFTNEQTVFRNEVSLMRDVFELLNDIAEEVKSYYKLLQPLEESVLNKCSLDISNIQLK